MTATTVAAVLALLIGAEEKKTDKVQEAPRVINARAHGVGRMVPDVAFTDLTGKKRTLGEFKASKSLIIVMTSSSCPLSKKYLPSIARLEKSLGGKKVSLLLVAPIDTDKPADLKKLLADAGIKAPCVLDTKGAIASALNAKSTTEAFVLDPARTLVYRGAIDDQYGLGYAKNAATKTYLADALTAFLGGKKIDIPATEAPGCVLDLSKAKKPATTVTYHNRISRIMQSSCVECHRKGGVGPFALDTYADVKAHRAMMRKVIDKGTMPPWFAAKTKGSHWANDRTLPEADKKDLLAWLKGDLTEGDKKDAPLPRVFPDGWVIGKPDRIVQIPRPIAVKAEGTMPYQNVTVKTDEKEDRWIQAMEIRPTSPGVVHHVLIFVQDGSGGRGGEERRGFFAAYVPGNSSLVYPEGFAKKLPKGASLKFQIHYTPNGKATTDQTRFGMIFARKAPKHEVHVTGIATLRLSIPPGAANHKVSAVLPVPTDAHVLSYMPHMHLRGKAFRYEVETPDGKSRTLLDIPRYDFNWQLLYRHAEPPLLKRGSKITATAWYDNSKNNPANPDPTKTVRWGQQTTDEMMIGYVEYYLPEGSTAKAIQPNLRDPATVLKWLDTNGDNKVSQAEFTKGLGSVPAFQDNPARIKAIFKLADTNKDGFLTLEEIKTLLNRMPKKNN